MFSTIERLSHSVTDAGNPIAMDLKTRYVIKGINTEKTIDSKVLIYYDESSGLITKMQDQWNGSLPTSSFADVSASRLLSPWWWLCRTEEAGFWMSSFAWYTWPWQVRLGLLPGNGSAVVPASIALRSCLCSLSATLFVL